jgi:hypothetical protein
MFNNSNIGTPSGEPPGRFPGQSTTGTGGVARIGQDKLPRKGSNGDYVTRDMFLSVQGTPRENQSEASDTTEKQVEKTKCFPCCAVS